MFQHAGHNNEIQLFSGHNQEGALCSSALHLFALACLPAQNLQCRLICGSGNLSLYKVFLLMESRHLYTFAKTHICVFRFYHRQIRFRHVLYKYTSCKLGTISVGWQWWGAFRKASVSNCFHHRFSGWTRSWFEEAKPLFIKEKTWVCKARSSPTASQNHIWEGAEGPMTLVAVNNDAHLQVYFWKTMIHTINSVVQWSVFPSSWQLPGVCFT